MTTKSGGKPPVSYTGDDFLSFHDLMHTPARGSSAGQGQSFSKGTL